jgi:redox-sensing transcriptional repressor
VLKIPDLTIKRLIRYYRYLNKIKLSNGEVILSLDIAKQVGVAASQVRKDLSYLGGLGRKGVGYEITTLKESLAHTLGFDKLSPIIIVGAGNLGRALCSYENFTKIGVKVTAIFDNDLDKIGNKVNHLEVKNIKTLESFICANKIKIAALTVTPSTGKEIAERLNSGGIKYIWNFAPITLSFPEGARVLSVDLSSCLGSLICQINKLKNN